MGQALDWPLETMTMGSVASYECPIFRATENYLHMQYSQCIFDEEMDEMIWWPPNKLPCNREFKLSFKGQLHMLLQKYIFGTKKLSQCY